MPEATKTSPHVTLDQVRENRTRQAVKRQQSVAMAVACELCPDVTPEVGLTVLSQPMRGPRRKFNASVQQRAADMIADNTWRETFLGWLDKYWATHHHGPTWRKIRAHDAVWPDGCPQIMRNAVLQALPGSGFVDGTRTPYGMKRRVQEQAK